MIQLSCPYPLESRFARFSFFCVFLTLGPWACAVPEKRAGDGSVPSNTAAARGGVGAANAELCDVESVYDGDTIWVSCSGEREKVRLYCIDAPEMRQKPWGEQSRDHLRGLLGPRVGVERFDTDRYGRTVAKLWTSDEDSTARMVNDGWAVVFPRYCPRSEGEYYRAERTAKEDGAGVWSAPGEQSAPWDWRRLKK